MKCELALDHEGCEDLAIRWQNARIRKLDELLRSHGLEDAEARETILSKFFFDMAAEFDGSTPGIEFEGRDYGPVLGFLAPSDETPNLLVSDTYALHEYVHSDIFEMIDGAK